MQELSLSINEPVCATWYSNIAELTKIVSENWGSPARLPQVTHLAEPARNAATARAQFFSGGVDSFFALITAQTPVDYLVTVQGFDVNLDDAVRFEHLDATLRQVASHYHAKPCIVRTNVRAHPVVSRVSWDDAHGGTLAAVGHLLAGEIGSIVIPPSWSAGTWHSLWGTHWTLDPLWSSSTLSVIHGDASQTRGNRIRAIADEPLVQKHLRVCFENRAPYGNCSECAKCVRTMAVLHDWGRLEKFSVFDSSVPIWDRIDALPYVTQSAAYDELLERGVEPRLESAIRRLLKRRDNALLTAETTQYHNQQFQIRNRILQSHNQQLLSANIDLEQELRRLQAEIAGMAGSRIWRTGNVIRRFKNSLFSSHKSIGVDRN
jgi:hypothetical protein